MKVVSSVLAISYMESCLIEAKCVLAKLEINQKFGNGGCEYDIESIKITIKSIERRIASLKEVSFDTDELVDVFRNKEAI